MCKPNARVMARYWDKVNPRHKSKRRAEAPLLPISAHQEEQEKVKAVAVDKTRIFPKGGFVATET